LPGQPVDTGWYVDREDWSTSYVDRKLRGPEFPLEAGTKTGVDHEVERAGHTLVVGVGPSDVDHDTMNPSPP
jgi:hypothetical protein